jgi:hypothetical protein
VDNLIHIDTDDQNRQKVKPAVSVCLLNAQSVRNKTTSLSDYVIDQDIDVMPLTETWLKPDNEDQVVIGNLCPNGYKLEHKPRTNGQSSGGVGILYRQTYRIHVSESESFKSFEHIDAILTAGSVAIRIIVIYRPWPTKANGSSLSLFYEEFATFLDKHVITSGHLLLLGDLNFHLDDPADSVKFKSLLDSYDLQQHVTGPTHRSGHTLDLVITRINDDIVWNSSSPITAVDKGLSDHFPVHFNLQATRPPQSCKTITYRKLKNVNIDILKQDISESVLCLQPADTIDELVQQYNKVLSELLDRHAPIKSKTVAAGPRPPWYNTDIAEAKKLRRQAERKWRASSMECDRINFRACRDKVSQLLDAAKVTYWSSKIEENSSDAKVLFKTVSTLWNKTHEPQLPTLNSPSTLANQFATFFTSKIEKICMELKTVQDNLGPSAFNDTGSVCNTKLVSFAPVTEEEILKIISTSPTKSCSLDPMPTWLLKGCLDILLPVITRIVNLSMSSGIMPGDMKTATIIPLLKKSSLDSEVMKNYRPVSNLSYLSKLIERVVAERLSSHIALNGMDQVLQSAYKKHHSTETALIKVQNDILRAVDNGQCVLLVLLDLSAAFDTVDHQTLLSRLSQRFGVQGDSLKWFCSYLTDRKQHVTIQSSPSMDSILATGVPQGSVLGPKLFTCYSSPLGDIMREHDANSHQYADDTQLQRAFDPNVLGDIDVAKTHIVESVSDIRCWMAHNSLKLNDDKTEFVIIGTKHQLAKVPPQTIAIGDHTITQSQSAKNIGAIFDSNLSFEKHIATLCKSARFHLRNIGMIRKYLDTRSTETLIHAFVTTKLDNMNSLLFGLPSNQLDKLQRIQNTAARVIRKVHKHDHITPILKELHWLPVKVRIDFKILLLTFRALHGLAPKYIVDMLEPYQPSRNLRSKSQLLLAQPATNLKTFGDRSFSYAAPLLWNKLPLVIRQSPTVNCFKQRLKTHFFKNIYT